MPTGSPPPKPKLQRLVVLSPFGVQPVRSGGHAAVFEPARALAATGVDVHLFGWGLRRFEWLRHWRSFSRQLAPRLVEERLVKWFHFTDALRRGRRGMPPVDASSRLLRHASSMLRQRCVGADLLQFEAPWLFGFGDAFARDGKPRLLVSHNVEAALCAHPDVARREGDAFRAADVNVCFTVEDRDELCRRYGARPVHVIPLGVEVQQKRPGDAATRDEVRRQLGVAGKFVVLFAGSWHLPNRQAAARIRALAAATHDRDVLFVLAGSIGKRAERRGNVWTTGSVPDLGPWFQAADVAVNPLLEGSGANVKLLDYMAYALPVVTTPFGCRGTPVRHGHEVLLHEPEQFAAALQRLQREPRLRCELAAAGRQFVVAARSWQHIAALRRAAIEDALGAGIAGARPAAASVLAPTSP